MIKELLKYIEQYLIPKARTAEVTIVRRDVSPTGRIGELYLDGRYVGMSCDALMYEDELVRHPLTLGFESGKRVLRTEIYCISRGDFTAKIPTNYIFVGSQEPQENNQVLSNLVDKLEGFKYIRLTVLNRYLDQLRRFKQ